jgi:hypothetical protein
MRISDPSWAPWVLDIEDYTLVWMGGEEIADYPIGPCRRRLREAWNRPGRPRRSRNPPERRMTRYRKNFPPPGGKGCQGSAVALSGWGVITARMHVEIVTI